MKQFTLAAFYAVLGTFLVAASSAAAPRITFTTSPSAALVRSFDREVFATIAAVKVTTAPRYVGSRSVRLPTREYHSIAVFDYEFPEACGGYRFRVYESGSTQILEYDYEDEDGARFAIRDYVAGANPFIKPGLWSSFDHTEDTVRYMRPSFGENTNPLLPKVYSKGFVTRLGAPARRQLNFAYRQAVKAASSCHAVAEMARVPPY